MLLTVTNLQKSYGSHQALKGVSLQVEAGTIHALVGHNGAGKSTCFNCISTLLKPTSGTVELGHLRLGAHPETDRQIRQNLGMLFQHLSLDENLSVYDNLYIRGRMYGMSKQATQERIAYLEQELDFANLRKRLVKTLSGGQKRKVDLARALMHKPQLLILDEPTTGIDPATRLQIWHLLQNLVKEGLAVLFSTHFMEEVNFADRLTVISAGEHVTTTTPWELCRDYVKASLRLQVKDSQLAQVKQVLEGFANGGLISEESSHQVSRAPEFVLSQTKGNMLELLCNSTLEAFALAQKLDQAIAGFSGLEIVQGNIDQAYVNLLAAYQEGKVPPPELPWLNTQTSSTNKTSSASKAESKAEPTKTSSAEAKVESSLQEATC